MTPEQEKLVLHILSKLHVSAIRQFILPSGEVIQGCQYCLARRQDGDIEHAPDCVYHLSLKLYKTLPDFPFA